MGDPTLWAPFKPLTTAVIRLERPLPGDDVPVLLEVATYHHGVQHDHHRWSVTQEESTSVPLLTAGFLQRFGWDHAEGALQMLQLQVMRNALEYTR